MTRREKIEVVGLAEIAELAGVSRQTVNNWLKRSRDTPEPLGRLRCGPIWLKTDIIDWLRKLGYSHLRDV